MWKIENGFELEDWEYAGKAIDEIPAHVIKEKGFGGKSKNWLHIAARKGAPTYILEKLLNKGLDIDATVATDLSQTALAYAADNGHVEVVKYLLSKGAHANPPGEGNPWTALHAACYNGGNLEIVKLLLDHGANVNALDHYERMPLHCAIEISNLDMVQCLIDRGAALHATAPTQHDPLSFALRQGSLDIVKCLVDHGADINGNYKNLHFTPLHVAALFGNLERAKFLLQKGADIQLKGKEGESVEDFALLNGHTHVAKYLAAVFQLQGCYTILTAVAVERISKKSPLKLLKLDVVKLLRDYLA